MGDVVDVRPDRFLHEMRDLGDFAQAAAKAGLSTAEAEGLCKSNSKFDLAVIEAHLEYLEDEMGKQVRAKLAEAREHHMTGYRLRHPEQANG